MTANSSYTTQLQAGLGMIPETLDLLRLWEPGMIPARLAERVIEEGLFSRTTARRARNLAVEMFAPRYLSPNGQPAEQLKYLLDHRFSDEAMVQLFFLYTSRAQRILRDFVVEVYWVKYGGGATSVTRIDAERFVLRSLDEGRMAQRWSESTIKRVSGYLLGCCSDFGLLAETAQADRPIQRFAIREAVALYLAYDLHFNGAGDKAIVAHPDWQLFGLESGDVLNKMKLLAQNGHFLVQSSGELVQISWKHQNMIDCLHALTHAKV